jgi:penicillin-binding protein 1A
VYVGEVVATDDAKNEVVVRVGTLRGALDLAKAARANPKKLPASKFAEVGALLRVSIIDAGTLVDGERRGVKLKLETSPEGALVAIDPRTREVLALVGGYDGVRAGLDRASRARRQPGSTFKAFVYSYALHSRALTAASLVETDPAKIDGYRLRNSGSVSHEPIRLRQALAKSVNVSAVWTLEKVGPKEVASWAEALGITSPMQPTPSMALGAYEATPREIANAYASLAAGGVADEPRVVLEIVAPSGRQVPLPVTPPPRRVMTPAEAYVTTSILREVVESGTGRAAKGLKRPVAGKTGTSNDGKDAWFAGYTADVACAVWVGFDDGAPLGHGESGAKAALPAWIDFMKVAHQGKPATDFPPAPGVVRVKIDPKTGLRARDEQEDAIEEVFLAGTEPTEVAPDEASGDEEPGDDEAGDEVRETEVDGQTDGDEAAATEVDAAASGDGPPREGRTDEERTGERAKKPAKRPEPTGPNAAADLPPF